MAQNYISGKSGSVTIGGVSFGLGKWRLTMKAGTPKITNFNGGGYAQFVAGITEGALTAEGPWDVGNMPLIVGNTYTFVLAVNGSVNVTVVAIVNSLEPSDDVEDVARVSIGAQVTGSFTAAIS